MLRVYNELRYFTPYFNSSIILNYEYACNIDVDQIEWSVTISEFSKLQKQEHRSLKESEYFGTD